MTQPFGNQPAFIAVLILLAIGAYGWGSALVAGLDRYGARRVNRTPIADSLSGPILIAIGLAVFLGFSGIVIAADLGYFSVLAGFLLVGVGISALRALRALANRGLPRPSRAVVLTTIAFLPGAFFAYGATFEGPVNANDDNAAYLYLARRLLATGGLIDPFNFRRLTSYGGGTVLQALVFRATGPVLPLGVEWFFAVLLCGALLVRKASRPYAPAIALVAVTLLAIFRPVGQWSNSTPTFSGVVLFLAMLQITVQAGRRRFDSRYAILIGLLGAGLVSLRIEFGVPAVVVVGAVALYVRRRDAWRPIAITALACAGALVGWAVALERSSGTFLFPLESGNYNTSFPWADPAVHGLGAYLSRLQGEIGTDGWFLEILAILLVVALVAALARRIHEDVRVSVVTILAGTLGCAVLLVAGTRSLSGGALYDVGRYNTPSVLGVVLLSLDELWTVGAKALERAPDRRPRPSRVAVGCVVVALLTAEAFIRIGLPGGTPVHIARAGIRNDSVGTYDVLTGRWEPPNQWWPEIDRYNRLNALVPPGAKVLAAVAYPGLLDFSRFEFSTLDIVGAASPAPGIPVLKGERAVVAYLRHLGYNGVAASVTSSLGLYWYPQWHDNLSSGIEDYRAMAVRFVAWARILSELARDPQVHQQRLGAVEYLWWSSPKEGS